MTKKGGVFLFILLLIILLVFAIHLMILSWVNLSLFENKIILSYIVNYILAAVILLVIQFTLVKKSSHSGFIFMAGSGLKFLVFFLVFYPAYRQNGVMETPEFAAFFVPYAVCLASEVFYLSKQLNNQSD